MEETTNASVGKTENNLGRNWKELSWGRMDARNDLMEEIGTKLSRNCEKNRIEGNGIN